MMNPKVWPVCLLFKDEFAFVDLLHRPAIKQDTCYLLRTLDPAPHEREETERLVWRHRGTRTDVRIGKSRIENAK